MTSFKDSFAEALPETMQVPDEFNAVFDFLEAQGCVGEFNGGAKYLTLDPVEHTDQARSCVFFRTPEMEMFYGNGEPEPLPRMYSFFRSGGDGSIAAFWLDDAGEQHIVHFGSGSGSTVAGIWTQSAIDFLRLISIGYEELCWIENNNKTPQEIFDEEREDEEEEEADGEVEQLNIPGLLQTFVKETFGVEIPDRADEIVKDMGDFDNLSGGDAFCRWLESLNK